jgi:hypothetical protein
MTTAPITDEPTTYRGAAADSTGWYEVFKSPSGNIRCGLASVDDTDWVSCFIDAHSWKAPPCRSAGATEVEFATDDDRAARFGCGDANSDPGEKARVLPYGHSLQEIAITCTSQPSGMACDNGRHGFEISRDGYRFH